MEANMRFAHLATPLALIVLWGSASATALSQQPSPSPPPAQKKPVPETSAVRLANARTILFTRARGNGIPFDVIKSTVEDWGRFTTVDSRDKADLVVEVATSGGDSGIQVSSSDRPSPLDGRPQQSTHSGVEFSDAVVTMTVYDAKSKRTLWTGTEKAKSAIKQTTRENNLVEAAEHLASQFHDKLEPPPPKERD
jgi:predicted Zn-dependent protease